MGLQTWTVTNNLPWGFQVGFGLGEVVLTPVQFSATLNLNWAQALCHSIL